MKDWCKQIMKDCTNLKYIPGFDFKNCTFFILLFHVYRYLNYGGIGVIIGHEITHGFDDRGRQFDMHGNLRQWWSDDVIRTFETRAQCFVDQYGNYTVKIEDTTVSVSSDAKQTDIDDIKNFDM